MECPVTVATFNSCDRKLSLAEEEIAGGGYPSRDRSMSSFCWSLLYSFTATAVVKVRLKVRTEDYEKALQLLQPVTQRKEHW